MHQKNAQPGIRIRMKGQTGAMGSIKEDHRVRRTRKSILNAFRKLALQKDLSDITIREIAEEADISRKTFYLHYHSIEDLLEELQNDFMQGIYDHMGNVMETKNGEEAFRRSLLYLAEDPEWSYLICSRYDYGQIWEVVNDKERRQWDFEEFLINKNYKSALTAYMIENLRTIFCLWYRMGMNLPAERMAEIGTFAVFHGTEELDRII